MSNKTQSVLQERARLNHEINERQPRLKTFVNDLLLPAYKEGRINAKTKHLIGLAVSIHTNCQDGIVFHITEALNLGVEEDCIMECLELCILDGGSLIYPNARLALKTCHELRTN